jgi:hypothetical protein
MARRSKFDPCGSKFLSIWLESKAKDLMIHIDKAPAHNSIITRNFFEHKPLKRLPHPPYSPNISPSDFYLFGKVKWALSGQKILDGISILDAATEILNGISTHELQRIFRSWIERVENVTTAEGGYASEEISMSWFDVSSSALSLV